MLNQPSYTSGFETKLLYKETYRDFTIYIYDLGDYPAVFIEIPQTHHYYHKHHKDIKNQNVHGGLVYSQSKLGFIKNSWFIGWDYGQDGDYTVFNSSMGFSGKRYLTEEILADAKKYVDEITNKK